MRVSQSKTRVNNITVRNHAPLAKVQAGAKRNAAPEPPAPLPEEGTRPLGFGERMLRNTAICVALLLCVVAVQSVQLDGAQTASGFLSEMVSMNLSESLGSLRFVSNLIPESVSVFWNLGGEKHMQPSGAAVVHVFSQQEPWIGYAATEAYASAAGEVMSLSVDAAGKASVRIRHASGMETIYGNLLTTYVREGDWVESGGLLGAARELTYELRGEGRAMDPTPYFQ